MRRREFLQLWLAAGGLLAAGLGGAEPVLGYAEGSEPSAEDSSDPWGHVPGILARIRPPVFHDREFDITRFGARDDNRTDATGAFAKAIAACHAAGGGRVLVPAGEFLTGAIRLKSNVNLHLQRGASVRFSRDPRKYPPVLTRFEGVELINYSPLIYAYDEENVAVSGDGTLDGNSDCEHWWPWKGRTDCGWKKGQPEQSGDRNRLFAMAERGVPARERVFGQGHLLRPMFIEPYRCRNVLIEGVTVLDSPMWNLHPVLCSNVTVRAVTVRSSGPNTDGCDPESCQDVLIQDCTFDTGDDCIAIKSGRNADGRRLRAPSRNIVIQNCKMKNGHGAVTVGSEISGGVENVFAENCQMGGAGLLSALRVKNNAMRGGDLERIYARNLHVAGVSGPAVSIDFFYGEGHRGPFRPVCRDVEVRKLTSAGSEYALYLRGFPNAPIEDVRLVDCDFQGVERPNVVQNARGISLRNVRINGQDSATAGSPNFPATEWTPNLRITKPA